MTKALYILSVSVLIVAMTGIMALEVALAGAASAADLGDFTVSEDFTGAADSRRLSAASASAVPPLGGSFPKRPRVTKSTRRPG